MELLEELYETDFKKIKTISRKVEITSESIILVGPPGCGKTYLVYNYLSSKKTQEYIYVNLKDFRVENDRLEKIYEFIKKNHIKIVAIDGVESTSDIPKLPQNIQLILCSRDLLQYENLKTIYLNTLDFEEFLLFDGNITTQITHNFNRFIKKGTLPLVAKSETDLSISYFQMILKLNFAGNELEIIKFFIKNIGFSFTKFQIFNRLKGDIKLSKDLFYKTIKKLQSQHIIFMVENINSKRAPSKIYFYDFAIRNAIAYQKNFINTYKNMIFIELRKRYQQIYYDQKIDFFIPEKNMAVLALPFIGKDNIKSLLEQTLHNTYSLVKIITMGYEDKILYNETKIIILPYWIWILEYER